MPPARKDTAEIFWSKVDKSGECWLWLGGLDKDGYGKFQITLSRDGLSVGDHTPQRYVRAHRYAWEQERGPVAPGRIVMHKCDMPACVNVAHLCLGTHAKNIADRHAKGRDARGSRSGNAKLNEQQVRIIRAERERGAPLARIADSFGVSDGTISAIATGRTWRHLG